MRAGQRAVRDAVAVHVQIPAEFFPFVQHLGRHDLAAVEAARVVPFQGRRQALVHADVEVGHEEDRRLQPLGEVERERAELEALGRVLGEEEHVLGVAVREVGALDDVGLLRARRHPGRGAAALHVDDHHRDLGEVREPHEFGHERDAGARGGGEGARAVPPCPADDADRGELVFGLNDRELVGLGFRIYTQTRAILLKSLGERRRGRDRVPRAHGRAAVEAAERGRFDEDLVADGIGPLGFQAHGALQMLARVVQSQLQSVQVRL